MEYNPITNINLVRFDVTKEHQINFSTLQAQTTFFDSLTGIELENATYQRKDNVIRYAGKYDDLEKYNYCFYENESLGKRYYCYIEEMKYINEGMTEIKIKTDVFQTWQFDFIYKQMFVEREHVNSDNVGEHTIVENLELGEYVCNSYDYTNELDNCVYFINTTKPVNAVPQTEYNMFTPMGGCHMAGYIYGCYFNDIATMIQSFANNPNAGIDTIQNIYVVPISIINWDFTADNEWNGQATPYGFTHSVAKPTTIDSYTPKNKKLLTFPYCYFSIDNNNGAVNIFHYEKFTTATCDFLVQGIPVCGCSIKATPQNYTQNNGYNESEGIICGKFPTLNWNDLYYLNWLQQNALNLSGQVFARWRFFNAWRWSCSCW